MATVTGITAERAKEIENATVVTAKVVGRDLILVRADKSETNVGPIVPLAVSSWPVGSIFMNETSTNPNVLLGGGTWVRWGMGRVPVGVDENQVEFNVTGKTNSSATKTHTLTINEVPWHNHGGGTGGAGGGQYIAKPIAFYGDPSGMTLGGAYYNGRPMVADVDTPATSDHWHTISGQGGGQPHNNLQPYITVYMWKRTA